MVRLLIFLALVVLAIKHKYLVGIIVVLGLLSAPAIIIILAIASYFLYRNERVKLWIELYKQKLEQRASKKKQRKKRIELDIQNFKSQSILKIEQKYNREIEFVKKKILFSEFSFKDERATLLENYIDEKELLIGFLQEKKLQYK